VRATDSKGDSYAKRGAKTMNILVCDDDREIVGAIEIYLKNEGYEVFKAYDGIEALDILRKEEIHLILMDIMMPGWTECAPP
jgi:DNA-binding response OmpR family regulator